MRSGLQWVIWLVLMTLVMGWLARSRSRARSVSDPDSFHHPQSTLVVGVMASGLFASIVIVAAPCSGVDDSPARQQRLEQLYSDLGTLFRRYYPDVTAHALNEAIHFEYNTRVFLVHEPLRSGEWQEARETRGPNPGGILCDIELRKGPYLGAAVVPQTFDKRYFKLLVLAPYSVSHDTHLYVHLYYPANVSSDFLREFTSAVEAFGLQR
jgi:hypothetical protein